jgi:hypothetical protein
LLDSVEREQLASTDVLFPIAGRPRLDENHVIGPHSRSPHYDVGLHVSPSGTATGCIAAAWHIDNKNVSIALIPLRDSSLNRCVADAAAARSSHAPRPAAGGAAARRGIG